MDHTTDEQLQSFLDHEHSDIERVAVLRHVEACVPCQSRLEALEALVADVSSAVGVLRPPPVERPALAALEARALAAGSATPAAGVSTATVSRAAATSVTSAHAAISAQSLVPRSRPRPRAPAVGRSSGRMAASWLRAAAVVLAVTGVAGAATIVVQRRALDRAEQAAVQRQEPADPAAIADPQVARSGVSVMTNAGRIVVAVRGAAAGTTIDVGVAASSAASAFVRGDGEGIRFSAQTGRIDVDATGRAITLDVRLPAGATNATVEVDGRIRARTVDGGVRVERGGRDVTVRARTGR